MKSVILSLAMVLGLSVAACSGLSFDYSDIDTRQWPNGTDSADSAAAE